MKRISVFILLCVLALACTNEMIIYDKTSGIDRTLVQILDYQLRDNTKVDIKLSEYAELLEWKYRGITNRENLIVKEFTIELPESLSRGERESFSLSLRKDNGLTTRASLMLVGKNPNPPSMIINELSIKGTSTAPDRIELLVREKGNTAGMILADGYSLDDSSYCVLPDLDVDEGDIIVVYWDKKPDKSSETRKNGKKTYYLEAGSSSTLISTDGMVVLFLDTDGKVEDLIIYSNNSEDEENIFGSDKNKTEAEALIALGAWYGGPVYSGNVTSSRVLARVPDSIDSDSAEDWFTTSARKSTFGDINTLDVYTP